MATRQYDPATDPYLKEGAPVARVGGLDVTAGGQTQPASGPAPGLGGLVNAIGMLRKAPTALAGGINKAMGVIEPVREALSPLATPLLAGLAAGSRRDPGPIIQQGAAQQRHAALLRDLQGIDPTTPEGLRQSIGIMMRHGAPELAAKFLELVQTGQIAQYKIAADMAKHNAKAPTNRTVRDVGPNGEPIIVNQEYDPATGQWIETGRGPATAPVQINMGEQKTFENVRKLAKDYVAVSKDWRTIQDQYQKMLAAHEQALQGNPQGYQALGVILQRIIDPPSVVRESEFARTEAFQSMQQRATSYLSRLQTGQVSPDLIEDVFNMGRALAEAAEEGHQKVRSYYISEAQALGVDPGRVVGVVPGALVPEGTRGRGGAPTAEELDAELQAYGIDPESATEAQLDAAYNALMRGR